MRLAVGAVLRRAAALQGPAVWERARGPVLASIDACFVSWAAAGAAAARGAQPSLLMLLLLLLMMMMMRWRGAPAAEQQPTAALSWRRTD